MYVRFNALPQWERDLVSFFDLRNRRFGQIADNGDATRPVTWQPAVDVYEEGDKLLLVADLPGLEEKDVTLAVEKDVLTLRGERRPAAKPEGEGYRRFERV